MTKVLESFESQRFALALICLLWCNNVARKDYASSLLASNHLSNLGLKMDFYDFLFSGRQPITNSWVSVRFQDDFLVFINKSILICALLILRITLRCQFLKHDVNESRYSHNISSRFSLRRLKMVVDRHT